MLRGVVYMTKSSGPSDDSTINIVMAIIIIWALLIGMTFHTEPRTLRAASAKGGVLS